MTFFKTYHFHIGVSIDGPEFLHNSNRVTRNGKGTFEQTMKGIQLLKKNDIPFTCISVVTVKTLDYADDFFSFFKDLNPISIGLNFEEVENINKKSSIDNSLRVQKKFRNFIERLYDLYIANERNLVIREFIEREKFILRSNHFKNGLGQQTVPYRIINVDTNGNFSTFSPELLTMSSNKYGDFVIGNVYTNSFSEALNTKKFKTIYSSLINGLINCKKSCEYFSVCGGGSPSNKYSENNSLESTETIYCKFRFQYMFDIILEKVQSYMNQNKES